MRIEAQDIAVRFGGTTVLHGVDLTVQPGELVGLIGPNGSGKTSLLRVLAGIRSAEGGAVRYDGRTVREIGRRELARHIAYLAQAGDVHWPMRVETLVALGRLPHRRPVHGLNPADRDAVARAMAATDVTPFKARTMAEVSAGERMRILLARALAVEAAILLADEPIAALDPLHQLQVMTLLHRTAAAGCGVVVVLHDLSLAARFCDRLVLLVGGSVLAQGRPPDVLTDRQVARAYGVEVVRGERDGVPFLVPWRPLDEGESP